MAKWKEPVSMLPAYVDVVVAMLMEMAEQQSAVAAQCFAAAVVLASRFD